MVLRSWNNLRVQNNLKTSTWMPLSSKAGGRADRPGTFLSTFLNLILDWTTGLGEEKIRSCFAYFPYDVGEIPSGTFIRGNQYAKSKGIGIIAGCDVNPHHICWGSSEIKSKGSGLLERLVGTELQILNLGNEPTFFQMVRQEIIDITVTSANIAALVGQWEYQTK